MNRTTLITVLAAALLVGMTIVAAVNSPMLYDRVTQTSAGCYENRTHTSGTSAHLETIRQNNNSSSAGDPDAQQYIRILQSNKSAKVYARPTGNDSDYENIALQYVSETYGIPIEELEVGNKGHRHFRMLDRKVWKMKVTMRKWNLNQGPFTIYEVFINPDGSITGADEVDELEAQDKKAHKEKYGKLEPALYDRLQSMQPNEMMRVIIDVKGIDRKEIESDVISRYPNIEIINYSEPLVRAKYPDLSSIEYPNCIRLGLTDILMKEEMNRTEIRKIEKEIRAAKKEAYALKEKPLIDYLTAKGYYTEGAGDVPTVFAILPKDEIIALQERDDVIHIWCDLKLEYGISTAIPTIRANEVWNDGYDENFASISRIAIVEGDGVDFSNPYLHGCMRPGQTDVGGHATQCAGVAASDKPTFRGVAYGATILSANADSNYVWDIKRAADWAIAEDAEVLSCSTCIDTGLKMRWLDRYFDKVVYEDRRTVVTIAGNRGLTDGNVTSPGLGYNVITVGGIDDGNNADWSDDELDPQSGYKDPISPDHDRNKPEVCAVSMPIRSTETEEYFNENGTWITKPPWLYAGTSYAAPAVAGEIAMLDICTHQSFTHPEQAKAIIMASAIHNAHGDKIDDKEGVGTVDASMAWEVLRNGFTGTLTIPPPLALHWIYFNAVEGEQVRFVICWCSHTNWDVDESYDVLESNLVFYIVDPQNHVVGESNSGDNNYGVVDFKAPVTGEYFAQICNFGDGTGELVGYAWSRIGLTAVAKSGHRYNNIAAKFDCPAHLDGSISYGDNIIIEYKWNFGDGEIGYGKTVEHGYEIYSWIGDETGHYVPFTASLTVKDDEGDTDTDNIGVNVYIAGDANGDGVVDILDAACVGKHYGREADNTPPLNCIPYWTDPQADEADLNNDGRVSTVDLMLVGTNWNHLAYPPYYQE